MLRGEVRAVASTDLAKYDFLVERIAELEAEQVETRLRPEESRLKGLQQTLASYESTLQELHNVSVHRQKLTHKAEECFDLLGKKHKQRRIDAQREKEQQACIAELAQKERIQQFVGRLEQQREVVQDLRKKTRELDAVRQAESDLVDRLFRSEGIVLDVQHGALEDAVCGLAPRIFKMREAVARYAVVHAKMDSAVHQLKAAAEELEHAFEPAHRALKDEFGDQLGEEFFDSADAGTKISAAHTADRLIKAAAQNLARARQRLDALPGLHQEEIQALVAILGPILQPGVDVNSLAMRRLIRDCINSLYISKSQAEYSAQSVSDQGAKVRSDLLKLEDSLTTSKTQLELHRRSLLSQVQEAKRSNSLRYSQDGSYSGSLSGTGFDVRARMAKRFSNGGMGDKVPSVNSGLSRLG